MALNTKNLLPASDKTTQGKSEFMEMKILWTSTSWCWIRLDPSNGIVKALYQPLCRELHGQNPTASCSCMSEWRFGTSGIPHVAFTLLQLLQAVCRLGGGGGYPAARRVHVWNVWNKVRSTAIHLWLVFKMILK